MRKSLKNSGIDIIGDVPWGTHFCQFYQTKEDLMDVLIPYFKAGLENNEFCMWVTSQPLDVEEAKEALKRVVPDVDVYLEKGQIEIIPYTHWYVKEGVFDSERVINGWVEKLNQALVKGYDGLRLTGNTFWLEKKDWNDFINYEKKVDSVIGKHQMMALCTYSLDRCNATEIIDVVSNHQFSLTKREGKWERIENSGRKRAEEVAVQAAKDWEQTFDAVPDLIAIIDTEYRVVRANRAMAARLEVTPEECVGETCYRVIHGTNEPPSFCPHKQLLKNGLEHTTEVCESCLGGYFLVSVSPLHDSEGKIIGSIYVARDITERKQAEKALMRSENEFRTLAENSPDMIVRFDRQKRHIYVNPAAAEPYGKPPEEIIDKTNSELGMDPEQVKLWERHYENVFTTRKPETMEFQYTSPKRKEYYFNTRIVPEFVDGEVTSVLAISRDVTDAKKAETELKEARDNLEELVKARTAELEKAYKSLKESENSLTEAQKMAHIGNWDWDLVTDEMYWSEEMYRIFGHTPREFGSSYSAILSRTYPDDRGYVDNAVKRALNGEPFSIDHRIISADGEDRVVHAQGEVVFDEKNSPIRMRGTVQDITERKKAEEKIETLADAVESSNDAIVTESLEGNITSWNKGAEQIYGYSAEEILGKNVSILEPDNIKGEIKQLIEKIKQGKRIRHYETLRLKKDGILINISITLSPIFDASGKLVAISAITRDITERQRAEEALRESEARLRRFYESNMIGVFYYNLDGSITDANDKFLEIVGYTREDLQAGRVKWDKMTPQEYRQLDEHAIAELKATGVNTPYEKEYIRKDGSRVPIIVGVATFDQACDEGIAFVLDITERKKVEETLENIEIARKKEIHHRIKNNLQVISSLLDLQAEKFNNRKCIKDSEVLEAFRESQDRVISMALIHEELYRGGGADTLNFSPYLEKLTESLFHTYRLGNIDVSLKMDLEENIFFDMDTAVPLGIIINELVSNSLKHAFPGGKKGNIQIKLRKEEKGKCKNSNGESKKESKRKSKIIGFTLTVSDNGVGIPENIDIGNPDTLGLQLITTLVDQLDGELELKRNNGTEFTIRFRVAEKL